MFWQTHVKLICTVSEFVIDLRVYTDIFVIFCSVFILLFYLSIVSNKIFFYSRVRSRHAVTDGDVLITPTMTTAADGGDFKAMERDHFTA